MKLSTIVGCVVAAGAVNAGVPMRNLNTGLCIQYNSADYYGYSLKLGSCYDSTKEVVLLRHIGMGKAIVSNDGLCLSLNSANRAILEYCNSAPRQQWTQVGVKQFQNGAQDYCLEVKAGKIVVSPCASLPKGANSNSQQWELKAVPKKPLKTCASSGLVCQKYDAKPISELRYCGNPQHPACTISRCCVRNPNTCAKAGIRCPKGQVFVNNYCKGPGNPEHPPCSQERCCKEYAYKTTCGKWNQCSYGYTLGDYSYALPCSVGGTMYGVSKCSNSLCCQEAAPALQS